MKKLFLTSILLGFISFHLTFAKPVNQETVLKAAKTFITARYPTSDSNLVRTSTKLGKSALRIKKLQPLEVSNKIVGYVNNLEPNGFVLFSADDEAPPVKIYSDDGAFESLPPGLKKVLELELLEDAAALKDKKIVKDKSKIQKYSDSWNYLVTDTNQINDNSRSTSTPGINLLTTTWAQGNPYNYYCPTITSGGSGGRVLTGCTATALGQILRYHQFPSLIVSNHTYSDNLGTFKGTYSVSDAGMDEYDWTNMPNSISTSSPDAQKEAIGQLLYHCGVVLESNYETGSTSAYPSDIPSVLETYFNYTCSNYLENDNDEEWYQKIANDIDNDRPVFYAMWEADNGNGHAVVCDGYRNGNEIHLNLGWSGSYDAWYNIESVNASGYEWTIHGAVFEITPAENQAPVLSNPRVNPTSGSTSTNFEFLVHYYDPDGDPPNNDYKRIYLSDGRVISMSLKSGSASNGTYHYTTTLNSGSYSYTFFFSDINGSFDTISGVGPMVYSGGNVPINIDIECENISCDLELKYSLNGLSGPWTDIPITGHILDPILVPSGSQVWFTASVNTANHEFLEWEGYEDGTMFGNGVNNTWSVQLGTGTSEISLDVYYDFTPQNYTISGTVLRSDSSTVPGGVDITLTSTEQTLSQHSNNGAFSFAGVKGGVSVSVSCSANGYAFSPSNLVFNCLHSNNMGNTVLAYSSDSFVPTTSFINVPPSISENSNISFLWTGTDDVTIPANLQYQYKLEGVDADWSVMSSGTAKSYDVNNGSYTFLVRAKDEAGNINQTPTKYKFVVNAASKVVAIERINNSIWASRITLQMPLSPTHPTQKFVLLREHSAISDPELVPVTIHTPNNDTAIGANENISSKLGLQTMITKCDMGWLVTLPEQIVPGQSVQYDILWGKIKYFGWKELEQIPQGFPNLIVGNGYSGGVRGSYLDEQFQMWRIAQKIKNRDASGWGSKKVWTFMDMANKSSSIFPERLLEYIPSIPNNGSYACDFSGEDGQVLKLGNNLCYIWTTEKYEKVGGSDYDDYRYNRYNLALFDSSGNPLNSFESSWQIDTFVDIPRSAIQNAIYITGRTYNRTANTNELWFSKHDSQGQMIQSRTVFESVSSTNSGNVDCWKVGAIGQNVIFLFERSHDTSENDDRQEICYQVRDLAGNIVKPSTVISPPLLPDSIEKDDEYEIESALIDNTGKMWISYSHWRTGQPYENYYIIIGSDGNIWKANTFLGNEVWREFVFCDKDGYIWATEGANLLIFNSADIQTFPTRSNAFIPNQNIGSLSIQRDYKGSNYRIYDRWTPQAIQIDVPENILSQNIKLYDLNLWNNDLHPANINLKKDDVTIWTQSGQFTDEANVDVSGIINEGLNILTMTQNDFMGGQVLITFPYALPSVTGDLNNDRVVDFADLHILVSQWLGTPGEPSADIIRDHVVDFLDFAAFAENWRIDNRTYQKLCDIPLDSNPNWTGQGQWQFGQPSGGGGSNGFHDPTSGYTGNNVYGVNLAGNYSTSAGGPYYLTTTAVDCRGYCNVHLMFARWLNTDFPPYAISKIEVSTNGTTWVPIWEHTGNRAITDNGWQQMDYDISPIADNQTTVYIRWSYQIGSGAYAYSGWNIDDIQFWGKR